METLPRLDAALASERGVAGCQQHGLGCLAKCMKVMLRNDGSRDG